MTEAQTGESKDQINLILIEEKGENFELWNDEEIFQKSIEREDSIQYHWAQTNNCSYDWLWYFVFILSS